jgi:hypothetical protein
MDFLTDPDGFFAEQADDPDWVLPALIVLSGGIFGAAGSYFLFSFAAAGIEGTAMTVSIAIGVGTALVIPFVLWLVYALVFYGISAVFDGEGSFGETVILTGWGYAPAVIGSFASMLAFYYAAQSVPPATTFQEFAQIQGQIQSHQFLRWTNALGLVLTLWQGVLWAYAMKHARNLSLRDAALTVALPVVVSVGFTINSLL